MRPSRRRELDLSRTVIRSPVNGYVTNLLVRLGDYATVGQKVVSVVDTDFLLGRRLFEETALGKIHEGDHATIELMGYSQLVRGHVDSIARGINVPNAQPDQTGLASVNPIFTWVRLAQRVPVRIHIDKVPDGVRLVSGMTATVQIDPRFKSRSGERPSWQAELSRRLMAKRRRCQSAIYVPSLPGLLSQNANNVTFAGHHHMHKRPKERKDRQVRAPVRARKSTSGRSRRPRGGC